MFSAPCIDIRFYRRVLAAADLGELAFLVVYGRALAPWEADRHAGYPVLRAWAAGTGHTEPDWVFDVAFWAGAVAAPVGDNDEFVALGEIAAARSHDRHRIARIAGRRLVRSGASPIDIRCASRRFVAAVRELEGGDGEAARHLLAREHAAARGELACGVLSGQNGAKLRELASAEPEQARAISQGRLGRTAATVRLAWGRGGGDNRGAPLKTERTGALGAPNGLGYL